MRGGDHVGPRRVHLRVDRERGAVHHRVALDDLAGVVDADQVGDADVLEVHPERVDPEVVEVLGVAHGDVAGDALVEAELAEQPERRREPLLAVQALLLDRVELREEAQVGKQCSHAEILGRELLNGVGDVPATVEHPRLRTFDEIAVTQHLDGAAVRDLAAEQNLAMPRRGRGAARGRIE